MAGFKHERRASQLKSHHSHGSRKSTLSATGPRKSRKPADDEHATVNQTKSRLRNVRRLLENKSNDMTGDQIQNLEREFATLQNDLQDLLQRAQYKKLVSKYHKIRFFERRKAERALKKAQKKAADSIDDKNEEAEIHQRQTDVNYTLYFPLSQPYVSLYTKEQANDDAPNRSSPVWKQVEAAMNDGSLEQLRNQPLTAAKSLPSNYAGFPQRKPRDKTSHKPRRQQHPEEVRGHTAKPLQESYDDDSDDNGESFFGD